jgi:hypothetical protein
MYEHPNISQQVTRFEQEQIARAAERRRFLHEHADQIVPRPAGPIRRMLRRVFAGRADAAPREAQQTAPREARSASPREAQSAAPREAQSAAPREAQSAAPREARSVTPSPRAGSPRATTPRTLDDCVGVGCEPVAATAR